MAPPKKRLGEILIDAGVLDENQLRSALSQQRRWGGRLGKTLLELGFVDERTMVLALSRQPSSGSWNKSMYGVSSITVPSKQASFFVARNSTTSPG